MSFGVSCCQKLVVFLAFLKPRFGGTTILTTLTSGKITLLIDV